MSNEECKMKSRFHDRSSSSLCILHSEFLILHSPFSLSRYQHDLAEQISGFLQRVRFLQFVRGGGL